MCHQLSEVLHTHCRNKSGYLLAVMFIELYLPIIQHANGFQQLWFVHIWLFYVTFGKLNLKPQIACKPCVVQMSLSNPMTSEPKSCLFFNAVFWGLKEYYCKNWTKKSVMWFSIKLKTLMLQCCYRLSQKLHLWVALVLSSMWLPGQTTPQILVYPI